jgi:hypothetical protein
MRKITLSDEEAKMDGAPTGDIYAVELKREEDLIPLDDPIGLLLKLNESYSKDVGWTDQLAYLENLRSIFLYHKDTFTCEYHMKCIDCIVDSCDAIRSSTMRSGLVTATLLIENIHLSSSDLNRTVRSVVARTAAAPKFIVDLAEGGLAKAFKNVDPWQAVISLVEPANHKNPDVVSKAFVLMGAQFIRIPFRLEDINGSHYLVLRLIGIGLNSRKVPGKVSCRNALSHLHDLFGTEDFLFVMGQCSLTPVQFKWVEKEVITGHSIIKPDLAATWPIRSELYRDVVESSEIDALALTSSFALKEDA